MKLSVPIAAAFLCLTGGVANAIDCSKAETPEERAICGNPSLLKQDVSMSDLYNGLRNQVASIAIGQALTTQQRRWVHHRENVCGALPDVACLGQLYGRQTEYLQLLDNAAAGSEDGKLHDLNVVPLTGVWEAAPLPAGGERTAVGTHGYGNAVSILNPPPAGSKIEALGSRLCRGGDCDDVSWRWSSLGAENGAARLETDLHLPSSQITLVGHPAAKFGDEVLLIPGKGGAMSALASICSERSDDCSNVLQMWKAIGTVVLPPRSDRR